MAGHDGRRRLISGKISGTGPLMLHGHRHVLKMELFPGKEIQAEMSHVLAFDETVQHTVSRIDELKTMVLARMECGCLFFAIMCDPVR